jgi:hypothetical protein
VPIHYSLKLKFASDRRHLDEMLHAIVARGDDLTYEIADSRELGPLGLPLSTSITFSAERGTPAELEAEVQKAIEEAGLSARFEPLA